ncbi:MAG TPA: GlsB/YeaQ/YmgE family stress response membrane protein [Kofleriaceae bacterium]|nr:GlsB/YeaQ/YmgE family stress response membrane protein [Kofleriaceae bacterium]
MEFIWMLIIGLVAGAIAKLIMPGKDPGGILVTMLLGVAGSLLAGVIGRAMGWYAQGESAGFIASIIGAVVLLAIYRLVIGRRHHRAPAH